MIQIPNGKKITLNQLQTEMTTLNLNVAYGLGTFGAWIFPYDQNGLPITFSDENAASTAIANHVAMRPLTDEELNISYADAMAKTPPDLATAQDCLAQAHGLKPRLTVPV